MYSEEYIVARRALLDALAALQGHRDALVLVGAQAIYLHTGAAQFAVAEFTTDGDVAIDPRLLSGDPEIASAMRKAKFFLDERNGRELVGGVGSRRGVTRETVLAAIDESLAAANRRRADVRALSTIDLKADEVGIREAADALGVPVRIVSRERIRTLQEVLREPTFAEEVTGVAAVCVPSALLADPHTILLAPPIARQGVTVAVAEDDCPSSASVPVPPPT